MVDAKNNIKARLGRIAEDFLLPGGRFKKIARLVASHFDWFEAAESRGMTWRDMVNALFAAGVIGRDGKPLSVGTLSSAVWRERALRSGKQADSRTKAYRARGLGRIPEPASKPLLPKRPRQGGTERLADKSEGVAPPARSKAIEGNAVLSGSGVLSFMKRAAVLRNGAKDS